MPNRITILDIPIDTVTQADTLEWIATAIAAKTPRHIVTVNPEFIVESTKNGQFKWALQAADLSLADGSGILWAASRQGISLPEKVTGSDLTSALAVKAAECGWKIFMLGGAPNVAEEAARRLESANPGLKIVGAEAGMTYRPHMPKTDGELIALLERINEAEPDILLVAFGAPKQELFISRFKEELSVPVMIGVGGTFDFLAGTARRAPKWMQNLGLEWLWRLVTNPKRYKRIWNAVVVFPYLVLTKR
jgi:N-acetylglucosaminyldiphosphoundecaprenol N-acetyl-beta-D-mannosaminyltransferase